MAIRVTQNTMYNNMVGHMQSNLSAYMESVQQGSSQKKINRPSDDPAGTYRVLTTRNDMVATAQYQENVDTAKGWLNLADSILSTNVATALTGLKALAEQASTGTYTAGQRQIMADQARQYFGQLLNLSNTQFEDMHIFGGHKYDKPAFQQGLAATSWDERWDKAIKAGNLSFDGASERTVLVQFTAAFDSDPAAENPLPTFRWSNDGGETWKEGNIEPKLGEKDEEGTQVITGYTFDMPGSGVSMTVKGKELPDVIPADTAAGPGANNGTMLYIRPTAYYQGDDKDKPVDVTLMGAGIIINKPDTDQPNPVVATGAFGKNVLVRIDGSQTGKKDDNGIRLPVWDQPVDLSSEGTEFKWSYSTDGGTTWVTAKGKTPGGNELRLPVPGGYIDYNLGTTNDDGTVGNPLNEGKLPAGMQANIHPSRADLDYEILKDTYISVNSVGKDVFGGYYEGKPTLQGQDGNVDANLFEVVGQFIGYLEGNNQEGCQKTLAALETAEKKVLAEATRIGGLENRVSMAADVLSFQKIDQQERLSYTEDIDLTELLTKLTRQQLTYQTVLQSSSMIMKLSLANYV